MYSDPFLYSPWTVPQGAEYSLHFGRAEVGGHYGVVSPRRTAACRLEDVRGPVVGMNGVTPYSSLITRAVYPHETTVESGAECAERSFGAAPLRPHFDGDFFDVGAFYGRRKGCQESRRQLQ